MTGQCQSYKCAFLLFSSISRCHIPNFLFLDVMKLSKVTGVSPTSAQDSVRTMLSVSLWVARLLVSKLIFVIGALTI